MADSSDAPKPDDQAKGFNKDQVALWRAELSALGGALLFVAIGFAAILLVAKVADVKDGTVLASLLIVPALLYLLLSGRVSDLKGPGGLEVQLAKVATQTIPMSGHEQGGAALSYEEVRPVERGRADSEHRGVRPRGRGDPRFGELPGCDRSRDPAPPMLRRIRPAPPRHRCPASPESLRPSRAPPSRHARCWASVPKW